MSMAEAESPLPPVLVRRIINAPREEVFAAWTDPAILVKWFGSSEVTVTHAEVDARVDGAYIIVMRGAESGRTSSLLGTYTAFRSPERLAFTWQIERADGQVSPQSMVTVDFAALNGPRTEIRLTHTLLSTEDARQGVRRGWGSSFDKLDSLLAPQHTSKG